jgi:hypothetical protein
MKFYIDKNKSDLCWNKILDDKLTCILFDHYKVVTFYKNGIEHNSKNAALVSCSIRKIFYLNGKYFGIDYDFTKKTWRKFVKLQIFK